jgi:hypothetical protein
LFAQYLVLHAQIIDRLSLMLIHPTCDGDHHKPRRIGNVHCLTLLSRVTGICRVFSEFEFLDTTRSMVGDARATMLDLIDSVGSEQ